MRKHVWLCVCALLVAAVLLIWLVASPAGTVQALTGESMLRWLTGGSGGGVATGSGYTLSDSIGQGIIGPSSAEGYRLNAGYQVRLQERTGWQIYMPIISK